jgi:hypothetical protein
MARFWNKLGKNKTFRSVSTTSSTTTASTTKTTPVSSSTTSTPNDTKFPWFQVIVLLCMNYNESVQGQVIFPFVPFAVAHWGVKEHDIGFYVGVLIASFFFAQLLLVSWWGRLADQYGRRPILLVGLCGTAITMLIFGFAKNYYIALGSRFLTGAMNGNIAISKVYMGELTTTKTQALGFSLLSFTWGLGIVTAPVIGGFLADPVTQFGPDSILGQVPFVKEYPYLLPSLFSVMVSITAFIGGFFLLPESEAWKKNNAQRLDSANKTVSLRKSPKTKRISTPTNTIKQNESEKDKDNNDIDEEGEGEETAMITIDDSSDENIIKNQEKNHRPRNSTDEELDIEIHSTLSKTILNSPSSQNQNRGERIIQSKSSRKQGEEVGTESKRKGKERIGGTTLLITDDSVPSGPLLPADAKISDILKDKVVVAVVTAYTMLSFVQIVFDELLPVLFSTPIAEGGFGFQSKDIGSMQIVQGISQIVWNLVFFPTVSKKFGLLPCFRFAMLMWTPFVLFPAIARLHPWPPLMWAVAGTFLCLKIVITASAFTCIILIINNSTRGSALGAVNGFAQASASFVRCVGPLVGGGLYTTSLIFGSYLGTWKLHIAYAVVSFMALSTFLYSFRVPKWCQVVWIDTIRADDVESNKATNEKNSGEEEHDEDEEESTPLNLQIIGGHS